MISPERVGGRTDIWQHRVEFIGKRVDAISKVGIAGRNPESFWKLIASV